MKLFYSPFHDFVHKVLVVAHEADVLGELQLVPTFPFRNLNREWVQGQYDIYQLNPLGKVPFLSLDDGSTLYSSQVVVEYLDSLSRKPLFPASGPERYDALRRLALGDALFEFSVQLSMEGWREPADRRADLYSWLWPKIERAVDQSNTESVTWRGFDIGHVGILQGLSYLDAWATGNTEIPENRCSDWRQRWPSLADWFDDALLRPSVKAHYRIPYTGDTSVEQHAAAVAAVLRARDEHHD